MQTLPKDGLSQAKHILPLLPFSRTTLYRKCLAGTFPKPKRLNANLTVWQNNEVLEYLKDPSKWERIKC
ncbi:hypothetical protein B0181_03365 [Moraxella caviae]|uniref:Predicted transcriptional regulator n=1 Tax=Moraxella caviae TaxID=34060 RepID=A0A1T0A6K8_9GAMM|nr:AlpA family phage regulatory protein [Moraxella caviae]OOR91354.1 hypothetical protein B0181_03365 [Moraxella caviae]STZ13966.1 Predicted transcriptional regulator [Moraxella caviae]VEW12993.1 Predicted transcriptional regulator [Moraxella caviae]